MRWEELLETSIMLGPYSDGPELDSLLSSLVPDLVAEMERTRAVARSRLQQWLCMYHAGMFDDDSRLAHRQQALFITQIHGLSPRQRNQCFDVLASMDKEYRTDVYRWICSPKLRGLGVLYVVRHRATVHNTLRIEFFTKHVEHTLSELIDDEHLLEVWADEYFLLATRYPITFTAFLYSIIRTNRRRQTHVLQARNTSMIVLVNLCRILVKMALQHHRPMIEAAADYTWNQKYAEYEPFYRTQSDDHSSDEDNLDAPAGGAHGLSDSGGAEEEEEEEDEEEDEEEENEGEGEHGASSPLLQHDMQQLLSVLPGGTLENAPVYSSTSHSEPSLITDDGDGDGGDGDGGDDSYGYGYGGSGGDGGGHASLDSSGSVVGDNVASAIHSASHRQTPLHPTPTRQTINADQHMQYVLTWRNDGVQWLQMVCELLYVTYPAYYENLLNLMKLQIIPLFSSLLGTNPDIQRQLHRAASDRDLPLWFASWFSEDITRHLPASVALTYQAWARMVSTAQQYGAASLRLHGAASLRLHGGAPMHYAICKTLFHHPEYRVRNPHHMLATLPAVVHFLLRSSVVDVGCVSVLHEYVDMVPLYVFDPRAQLLYLHMIVNCLQQFLTDEHSQMQPTLLAFWTQYPSCFENLLHPLLGHIADDINTLRAISPIMLNYLTERADTLHKSITFVCHATKRLARDDELFGRCVHALLSVLRANPQLFAQQYAPVVGETLGNPEHATLLAEVLHGSFENCETLLRLLEPIALSATPDGANLVWAALRRRQRLEQLRLSEQCMCPITNQVMDDPVRLPSSAMVVDRATIRQHLLNSKTDPFNRSALSFDEVQPLPGLRRGIACEVAEKLAALDLREVRDVLNSMLVSIERAED